MIAAREGHHGKCSVCVGEGIRSTVWIGYFGKLTVVIGKMRCFAILIGNVGQNSAGIDKVERIAKRSTTDVIWPDALK